MTTTARCSLLVALLGLAAPLAASAQSCAAPIEVTYVGEYSSNTCNNSNQLPYLANGAISAPGSQDVFHMRVSDGTGFNLQVQPPTGVPVSMFVCRNQCSTYATCIAAVDSDGASLTSMVPLPPGAGEYYIVVQTAIAQCGSYNLVVSGLLRTQP
jgi:hypothetical protein